MRLYIPKGYNSILGPRETEKAINRAVSLAIKDMDGTITEIVHFGWVQVSAGGND